MIKMRVLSMGVTLVQSAETLGGMQLLRRETLEKSQPRRR